MQVRLSLFAGILAFNGVTGNPVTQNCGSAECQTKESMTCQELMATYTFTGTCCALDPTPDGGCLVYVSSGICYYEPLAPCEGCAPGAGGKFLGSGNANGCRVTQFNALVGTAAPTKTPDVVLAETSEPTASPVAKGTPPPTEAAGEDGPIAAEKEPENTSSASRMGVAAVAVASAVALLL